LARQLQAVDEILEYLGLEAPSEPQPHEGRQFDFPAEQVSSPARPTVTVTWAQSLDGAIAVERGTPTRLSGDVSIYLTHRLRALHDTILVGVGTVLSDMPRLTTRLCDGDDPVPVVLDSHLRCPPEAPLFERSSEPPVIVWSGMCRDAECDRRRRALEARGARLMHGDPYNLPAVLDGLWGMGMKSVMVEGGGRIMASFFRARLVERLVVTVVPRMLGGYGLSGSDPVEDWGGLEISRPRWWSLEHDAVVAGRARWR
jgi:GTP cyclohydrolase II